MGSFWIQRWGALTPTFSRLRLSPALTGRLWTRCCVGLWSNASYELTAGYELYNLSDEEIAIAEGAAEQNT
jgi:hypothetical protein